MNLPLRDLTVLEFGQYLSGPSAGLRLADLGARVIKIERPGAGDACRRLSIKNLWAADGNSLLFHTINRNKESLTADMKSPADKDLLLRLVAEADVLLHNFRPGVMEEAGLGYADTRRVNPRLVYAVISGYGPKGPWRQKPGQDLLLQSMTGLAYTTGNEGDPPVPFGLSIADTMAGVHIVQGVLGGLVRRQRTGSGAVVEVSMLESLVDFQFELMTTYLNGGRLPERSAVSNGNPLLSAPYGVYATADGFLAVAMMDLRQLGRVIGCAGLADAAPSEAFSRRDALKSLLAAHLVTRPTAHWLPLMQAADLWAMPVHDWDTLTASEGYRVLGMEQDISLPSGKSIRTLRCPIRLDGLRLYSERPAPLLGPLVGQAADAGAPPRATPAGAPKKSTKLLEDLIVVDLSQFLSGPSAALRLADMGARVIKIERPGTGDICRQLYVSDVQLEGESTIFHAINRHKQSYAADLKDPGHLEKVKRIIDRADVVLHNFRPGVIERLGLDYASVKKRNPWIVYAEVSGYGAEGPWKDLPGQDLLVQAVSGLTWLSHDHDKPPTPMGVAVVDILAGSHVCQGILALLYRRMAGGQGGLVQVSMLESIMDFQFEAFTSYLNDGRERPRRSALGGGNPYIAAPYGIYPTSEGFLALAMTDIPRLGRLLDCAALAEYTDPAAWFDQRDWIKARLATHLAARSAAYWLSILEPAGVWCARVLDYDGLRAEEGYRVLDMEINVETSQGMRVRTTRCPIRVDGLTLDGGAGAPLLGEHNDLIERQFALHLPVYGSGYF